jgi:hypothetical protein
VESATVVLAPLARAGIEKEHAPLEIEAAAQLSGLQDAAL